MPAGSPVAVVKAHSEWLESTFIAVFFSGSVSVVRLEAILLSSDVLVLENSEQHLCAVQGIVSRALQYCMRLWEGCMGRLYEAVYAL